MKLLILFFLYFSSIGFIWGQQTPHLNIDVLDVVERQGELWVASNIGLFQINKSTLVYKPYTTNNSLLPQNHTETLSLDKYQNLWIGTYDLALLRVTPNNSWTVETYPNLIDQKPLPPYEIYDSGTDSIGTVWLGTDIGLLSYDGIEWKHTDCTPCPNPIVYNLKINSTNVINVAGYNFFTYDVVTQNWTKHLAPNHRYLQSYGPQIVQQDDNTLFYFVEQPIPELVFKIENNLTWTSWFLYDPSDPTLNSVPITPSFKNLTAQKAPNGRIYYNTNSNILVYYENGLWYEDHLVPNNNININTIEYFYIDHNGDFWLFEGLQMVHYTPSTQTHRTLLLNPSLGTLNNGLGFTSKSMQLGNNNTDTEAILEEKYSSKNSTFLSTEATSLPSEQFADGKPPLTLSPNPALNELYIDSNADITTPLQITNNMGITVLTLHPTQKVVDISKLPNGIYWLIARDKKQTQTIPFLKI